METVITDFLIDRVHVLQELCLSFCNGKVLTFASAILHAAFTVWLFLEFESLLHIVITKMDCSDLMSTRPPEASSPLGDPSDEITYRTVPKES